MAGDENEAGHGASKPLETPHEPVGVEPIAVDAHGAVPKPATASVEAEPAPETPAMSEWVASDARGPLNAVGSTSALKGEAVGPVPESSLAPPIPPLQDPPVSQTVPPRKASRWPIAAGIVVGAIIGAGSAYYVYWTSAGHSDVDQQLAALTTRVNAIDAKPDAQQAVTPLKAALADLTTKVAAAEAAARAASVEAAKAAAPSAAASQPSQAAGQPGAGPDLSAVQQKIAALQATVTTLQQKAATSDDLKAAQDKLAALGTSVTELKTQSSTAQGSLADLKTQSSTAQASLADLKTQSSTAQASLADLKTQSSTAQASLTDLKKQSSTAQAAVTDLQKQASTAQADVQTLRAGQKSLEGKITSAPALAVVSDSLVSQIQRGLPFVTQVNALEQLGVDPAKIAILRQSAEQGVPSAKTLGDKFDPLTDGLISSEHKGSAATVGFWDRMKNGVGGLVSIHRVDDVSGDDVPSRVARIKADLVNNDVIDAVATWNKLPPETKAKPEAAAWGALAKTHAEAIAAAQAIEHDAIASLGPKKS